MSTSDTPEPTPSEEATADAANAGPPPTPVTPEELAQCVGVLQRLAAHRSLLAPFTVEQRAELYAAAGRVSMPTRQQERQLVRAIHNQEKARKRAADRERIEQAGLREQRRIWAGTSHVSPPQLPAASTAGTTADDGPELIEPRTCYVCKTQYRRVHFFYDAMCRACGDFNFQKRSQTAPLPGRVALLTGARLKIGYQAALMLLRAGCRVIVTTRFPRDAARRFTQEKDHAEWKDRVQVCGLDLRHTPSVELFCQYLDRTLDRLDFIINNAAQTVRRPPGFYAHLIPHEQQALEDLSPDERNLLQGHEQVAAALRARARLPSASSAQDADAMQTVVGALQAGGAGMGLWGSAQLSMLPYSKDDARLGDDVFPRGRLDVDQQQVDLRDTNSWRLRLAEVPAPEMLEVQLVNAVAPFILNARLKPLMLRERTWDKHIVNVSAIEGQFSRGTKTDKHPHTNMAKAALNMMTRTSAKDYARDGIYMNSVDTGWVTDEDPAVHSARKEQELGFQPPLDIVDGAARIVDPIFHGKITGQHAWGCFLKDYKPTDW